MTIFPSFFHPMSTTTMSRTLLTMALCASMTTLATHDAAAGGGRGGGYSGGGMPRGGSGGMQRGSYGGEGGGMSHSPSFSQPRSQSSGSSNENRNAGAAAAGAGYSNKNESPNHPNAAPAAAGAGYANRNDTPNHPNAAPAAAGAGYANRNDTPNHPNAAPAAAGAAYSNRNQSQYPYAGAATAGAAYANNNHGGYWNGNYGTGSIGSYGGMGMASPAYGYGSMPYVNPYAGMMGSVGAGQPVAQGQPGNAAPNNAPAGNPSGYDYTQPVNTAAAPNDQPPPTDPSTAPAAQAFQAFQSGDYAGAVQLARQALGQAPNDVNLHQFLALGLFAQGNYDQAAAPLYAVLAVGPGWDWTTLIGNYPDASTYTGQLRGLEAYARANPRSANALLVEAYHYICQGQGQAAIKPLKALVALQPNDRVSAQLLESLQPQSAASLAQPLDPGKLPGVWVAQAPPNATVTLTISGDSNFTWQFAAPGKPPVKVAGPYTLAGGVLTLAGTNAPGGPLAGKVTSTDDKHMTFRVIGAPSSDPGLQFVR